MSLIKSIEFFPEHELMCHCNHCPFPGMDEDFLTRLWNMRVTVGLPFILSSAYRCPAHNSNVSRTGPNGPHTTSKAVDILCSGALTHLVLAAAFEEDIEMSGIGISQKGPHGKRFIHVDSLEDNETKGPRPWVWSY